MYNLGKEGSFGRTVETYRVKAEGQVEVFLCEIPY